MSVLVLLICKNAAAAQRLLLCSSRVVSAGMMQCFDPVKVAVFQPVDQHLGGGDVGSHRDIVHIALPQQKLVVGLAGLGVYRVTEKQQHIHLTAGHLGRDLLGAAARAGV